MAIKKTAKKKSNSKKLGINPTLTLKPVVVETRSRLTEEEQNENPLNRMKELPDGFKTADQVTERDDLEFENGRLREMLVAWLDRVMIDGIPYQVMIDPLNRVIQVSREKYGGI